MEWPKIRQDTEKQTILIGKSGHPVGVIIMFFRALATLCTALYQMTKIQMFSNLARTLYQMGRVGDAAGNVRRRAGKQRPADDERKH